MYLFPENIKKSTAQQVHVTERNFKNLIYKEKKTVKRRQNTT